MATFIAFLRAVNLGRTRKVPMADARVWLGAAGLGDVETYIQTGNVRFTTSLRSRSKVERVVEEVLEERCGFDVPAMVFTPAELRQVYDDALALPLRWTARCVATSPSSRRSPASTWPPRSTGGTTTGRPPGSSAGRCTGGWPSRARPRGLSNARIEKVLGPGTTRDLKVVTTLAERWGG